LECRARELLAYLADWCALGAEISDAWINKTVPSAALMSVHRRLANDLGLNAIKLPTTSAKPNRFLVNAIKRK